MALEPSRGVVLAAEQGQLEEVERFLDNGGDVDAQFLDGSSAVLAAASKCSESVLSLLLKRGADLNAVLNTERVWTALHVVVSQGLCNSVELLLKLGADVHIKDKVGYTPLHLAVTFNFTDIVQLILTYGVDPNTRAEEEIVKETVLHTAVFRGNLKVVQLLLDHGADMHCTGGQYGWTPLAKASGLGHLEVVRLLLERGADATSVDLTKKTALHHAVGMGHLDVVRLLLSQGAPVNCASDKNETPLMTAVTLSTPHITLVLLQHGADLNLADEHGHTSLHLAATRGDLGQVQVLLEKPEVNVNAVDLEGHTALHRAVLGRHTSVVVALLNAKAEVNLQYGYYQWTALHKACWLGHTETVENLVAFGADIQTADRMGYTALHMAAHAGCEGIISKLIDLGCPLDTLDKCNRTPLHVGVQECHPGVVRVLLECGAAYDASSMGGLESVLDAADEQTGLSITHLLQESDRLSYQDHQFMSQPKSPSRRQSGILADVGPHRRRRTLELKELMDFGRLDTLNASLHQMIIMHNRQQLQSEMRKRSLVSLPIGSTPTTLSLESGDYITFSGDDILRATNNFASENLLGRGSFSAVYKGRINNAEVAVKRLLPCLLEGNVDMIVREMEVMFSVRHKHLVQLYGWCPTELSLVLEMCSGGTLEERLMDLSWCQRLKVAHEVAMGMFALHSRLQGPVVHRDIKLANVVFDHNDVAKICDFGLSCFVGDQTEKPSVDKHPVGTKAYMDPEYCVNGVVGTESDVYSLGVILLQMLCGKTRLSCIRIMTMINQLEACLVEGDISDYVDPRLEGMPHSLAVSLGELIINCCEWRQSRRLDLASSVIPYLETLVDQFDESLSNGILTVKTASAHCNKSKPWRPTHARQLGELSMVETSGSSLSLTPLHLACWEGKCSREELKELLQQYDINAADMRGWTPLHWAAYTGNVAIIKTLLAEGASKDVVDKVGWTPLHRAAAEGLVEATQCLIKAGANVNAADSEGNKPLHTASCLGHGEVVTMLIGAEASMPSLDMNGMKEIAASEAHTAVVKRIQEHCARTNLTKSNTNTTAGPLESPLTSQDDALLGRPWHPWLKSPCWHTSEGIANYPEETLVRATGNWSEENMWQRGVFWVIYNGRQDNGDHMLVRRMCIRLREQAVMNTDVVHMLHMEVEVTQRCRHQHILPVVGWCPRAMCLVHGPCIGSTLEQSLPKLGWHQRVRIAHELCQAVECLHTHPQGVVVHRNLKLINVVLTEDGTVKLTNFGLCKLMPNESLAPNLIAEFSSVGDMDVVETFGVGYQDPIFSVMEKLGPWSDIFDLGVIFLRLFLGITDILTLGDVMSWMNLLEHAMKENGLGKLADSSAGEWPEDQMHGFCHLLVWCCEMRLVRRPSISDILPEIAELCNVARALFRSTSGSDVPPCDEVGNLTICSPRSQWTNSAWGAAELQAQQ